MRTFLHFTRFLLRMDLPVSQVSHAETALLRHFAADKQTIVELGCFEGKTTADLAEVCNGMVFTVDPFLKGRLGVCYGELISKTYWSRLNLTNIRVIKLFSHEAANKFDQPVDFIFIDADHSYEAITRDWADWKPLVRNGGIIALHDAVPAPNSELPLGSMRFYADDVSQMSDVRKIEAVDSLVLLQVSR